MLELKQKLKITPGGFYECGGVHFVPTAEVNNQFLVGGKNKRIHTVLIFPSLETAEAVNKQLARYGDLNSDGRPLLRLSARDMVKLVLDISSDILVVPAHAWTPHFSIFGSYSGFDTVEECFGDQAKEIHCLETGLSSDPEMNWRLSRLDRYTLISNSDSHSASRIGREANVFDCKMEYREVLEILKTKDAKRFLYTVEFFPEEGKYHFDGHRPCKVRFSPEETARQGIRCPACGKKITVGVMNRVQALADRPIGQTPEGAIPFKRMVPLDQIISEAREVGVQSKKVQQEYLDLVGRVGTEFEILIDLPAEALRKQLPQKLAEGILRVRKGEVEILPGYDGEYGEVNIFKFKGKDTEAPEKEKQLTLF